MTGYVGGVARDPQPKLPIIDALRGVAIAGVILVHADDWFPQLAWPLARLTAQGGWGVQLFFVLSAVTLLMSWHARKDAVATPPFLIRRFFRVAPMFYGAIVLYALLDGVAPRAYAPAGVGPWDFLATALFLHGWLPTTINSIVPGGWSIAAEWTFYLLFPLLAQTLTTVRRCLAALAVALPLGAGLTYAVWHASGFGLPDRGAYLVKGYLLWWFPTQLPVFLLGFLAYHLLVGRHGRALAWAGGLAALGLAFVPLRSAAYLPYALASVLLVVGLMRAPSRWVANPALVHLGKVSYSAYFLHFLVIRYTGPLAAALTPWDSAGFVAYYGAAVVLTTLAATLTYHWIELPGIALGRRLAASWPYSARSSSEARASAQGT
ncbi:MAG: acyltransferase 3 [Cyanobacteria bacterium RYN_339]|nr:acyltransferase 3 [Cyanobacteria bacterium RYN_339]